MPSFAASPFLDALGWALLNSIWQFGVLWCVYYVLTALIKSLTAAARHNLAVYLLVAGAGWFVISLSWKYYSQPAGLSYTIATDSNSYYSAYQHTRLWIDGLMPWWSAAYLVCIAVLFIKFCLFVRQARQLQQQGLSKLPVQWRIYVKDIAALLGIEKTVSAVVSARVDTPQVIGFLKPIILVPLACINRLNTQQVEAVLLHELIHIKRNDYLVNLFVATAEILFFFNPFVKQLITAIRREREYSCDDMVLQFQYQPQQYASALLSLERERTGSVTLGIAAGGHGQKQLLARVQRIVGIKINHHKLPQAGAWLAVVMLLGFIAMVNPVKMVEEKINPALQEFALTTRHQTWLTTHEQPVTIVNFRPLAAKEVLKAGKAKSHTSEAESDDMESNELELQPVSSNVEDLEANHIAVTLNLEQRNFSMPEGKLVTPPPPPDESALSPYVPNNSFSYQFVPDTSIPRLRGETFQEKQARESLSRAKKALEQINWQRIERDLKYKKNSIEALKAEIAKELAQLNWQQINNEVMEQQKINDLQKARAIIMKDQAIKAYQDNEAYQEAIRQQSMEKDQLLKDMEKHQLNQQKTQQEQQRVSDEQTKKIQDEMRKKRIVYI